MPRLSLSPSCFKAIKKISIHEKNLKASEMMSSNELLMARFYLLDELSFEELTKANSDMLLNQVLLGRFLASTGAEHSALRIAHKILILLQKGNKNFSSHLYYQMAAVFLETSEAYKIIELAKIYKKNNYSENLSFELILLQYKIYSGKTHFSKKIHKKYEVWISKFRQINFQLQEYIQYLIYYNLFYNHQISYRYILDEISKHDTTLVYNIAISYSHLKAKCYLFEENYELALKALNQHQTNHFYFKIESFFLKKYYLNQLLTLENEISLHCYPVFNSYLHICGNRFLPARYKISKTFIKHLPYLEKKVPPQKDKFWLIQSGTLRSYKICKAFYQNTQWIDLVSGIIKTQGKIISLGKTRSLALMAIISTGSEGSNEYLMSDIIYPDEKISHRDLFLRAQDLVTQLQKLDLPVYRKDKKIFFNFKKNKSAILISKNYKYMGELFYIANHYKTINRAILSHELSISIRTASHYIKKWHQDQRIEPDSQKYGNFKVISQILK